MGGCIRQVATLSGWIMGYTFVQARLGFLHLGCKGGCCSAQVATCLLRFHCIGSTPGTFWLSALLCCRIAKSTVYRVKHCFPCKETSPGPCNSKKNNVYITEQHV